MERLNPQQVVALVIRLFAIWLVLYAMQVLANQLAAMSQVQLEDSDVLTIISLGFAVPVLVALYLWFFPVGIANRLIRPTPSISETAPAPESDLYSLAFIVLGVYLLSGAISDTAYWWGVAVYFNDPDPLVEPFQLVSGQKASILSTVVEFVMALFLIFGSKVISQFIRRLRYAS